MAKKPTIVSDDKDQSQRFVDTASELGIPDDAEAFERALDAVVPDKPTEARKAQKD